MKTTSLKKVETMQAIQFKTIVHDEGTIKISECYRAILQGEIQLIVLFQDNLK